ncbi:cytidylyltransferase domain-containing protein, partial [Helicobacter rodentium]|uniref:cytidylyltransferase domain-containing protein n=1 Tax=Helicobacter rodentium TaxID=59617 RepID=UPI00069016A6
MRKILAIIPARGGSKGIPKKNIASLSGKPLIIYTIEAALNSKIFSDIIVTTDSDEIAELVSKQGISTLKRPHELATDTASSIDVIDHVLKEIPKDKYDCFALLQPTSPLRNAMHIQEAWELYKKNNATTLVSVVSVSDCPQKMLAKNADNVYPITSYDDLVKPRQQLDKAYIPNGAIYICNIHNFLKTKFLFENKLVLFEMNERDSIDIDTPKDLECAENILKEIAVNKEINSNIKEMVDILSVNMAKATLLYKEEKYIQATEVFSLEEKESNFGAIQMIGVCFFKAKEFDKTIEYLSRSVSKFPTKSSKQAYLYLFNSYVQLNNDTACFEVVQEALANKKVDGRMAKAILEFLCKIEDMQYLSLITQIYPIYEKFCHENNTGIPQRFKVAYAKYNCSLNSTYNKKTIEAPKDLLDLFEVLIPTYQRKEVVISTIREIKKVNQWVHIRVIDNASTDGTYEALKKLEEEYPNLYVFQNEENIGYAGSMFRLLKDCPKKFGIFTSDE